MKAQVELVQKALDAADQGQREGLRGMFPAAAQILATEVRRLQKEDEQHAAFKARILRLLMEMQGDEILSEQQCARYWGGDLLDWRIASQPAPGPHPFEQEGEQS